VLADVAEITVAGGDAERGLRLIDGGIKLVRDDRGAIELETLRALGTLLHNKANTMAVDLVRRVRSGSALPYTMRDLATVIGDAAEIRERLAGVDGLAIWELANTVQLAAQIAHLSGDRRVAVELVCRAGALCARLGPAAGGIVTRLFATGEVLAQEAPAEVAAARATGRWPLP
jgi:hypothetical protein